MPNVYHSDLHLPRWRRAVIWLCESEPGRVIVGLPLLVLCFGPGYWLGVWWLIIVIVACLAFSLGWNAARRRMIRDGWVDKV